MKLKKAMREYARAVDEVALVTERIRWADGLNALTPELLEWRNEARREKQRTVRQMNAVMVAMQYRGANKIWYIPQKREITHLRSEEDVLNAYGRAALMGCTRGASDRYLVKLMKFRHDDIQRFKKLLTA